MTAIQCVPNPGTHCLSGTHSGTHSNHPARPTQGRTEGRTRMPSHLHKHHATTKPGTHSGRTEGHTASECVPPPSALEAGRTQRAPQPTPVNRHHEGDPVNQPPNLIVCPECTAGKHSNCDGTAMDLDTDRLHPCSCALNVHGLIPSPGRDVSGSARARGAVDGGSAVTDPQASETPRQCKYLAAACPTLTAEDTCAIHRHEPRVFALAEALARAVHEDDPTDEQIGWFVDDADAVVDDFDPTPETWEASSVEHTREPGLDATLTINGRAYVLQEADWEPAHPVARATWESWLADDEAGPR